MTICLKAGANHAMFFSGLAASPLADEMCGFVVRSPVDGRLVSEWRVQSETATVRDCETSGKGPLQKLSDGSISDGPPMTLPVALPTVFWQVAEPDSLTWNL